MVNTENTRCEFTREVQTAAVHAREKAAADWAAPLAPAYAQVALELLRVLEKHAKKCPICLEEDARPRSVNRPTIPFPSARTSGLGRQIPPPRSGAVRSLGGIR
jgi:hypothetical protein